ncbi:hypothetical protein N9Z70_02765 [Mariniblastus sp.]|nr:hypothetical protein [Mariniblastus sp.]MDB4490113.1 hypothetical protein [bacterium]
MRIFIVFLFWVAPCGAFGQEVFEVNGADIIVYPDAPTVIAASATGRVEMTDATVNPVFINTQTFAQVESDMPDHFSGTER